jgi:hypothetical protein
MKKTPNFYKPQYLTEQDIKLRESNAKLELEKLPRRKSEDTTNDKLPETKQAGLK